MKTKRPQGETGHGVRLALVAPSGAGKSTVAKLLKEGFEERGATVAIIKLASPLYRLQSQYYDLAHCRIKEGSQDQSLLEQIARDLRRINPMSFVENFRLQLQDSQAEVVINDDLRDDATDWPFLRDRGFKVIRIAADLPLRHKRLKSRSDASIVLESELDRQINRIPADVVLENNGTMEDLQAAVERLVDSFVLQAVESGESSPDSRVPDECAVDAASRINEHQAGASRNDGP